jgi:hypothetical protein
MYAFIAGSCGSASLGFTCLYQAGLAEQGFSVFTPFPLSQHALFPFGFHLQVGWVTQKSFPPNFSSLREGSSSRLNGAHRRRT